MPNNSKNARKRRTRELVLARDGNKCVKCGSTEDLTIDHIHPLSEGGVNHPVNMQTLCVNCNVLKASKIKLPFWQHIRKLWYIHDYVQNWKNEMKGIVQSVALQTSQPFTNRIDDFNKRFELWKVGHENRSKILLKQSGENAEEIKALKKSIEEKEDVIRMLVEYLDVKYIPYSPLTDTPAYFAKRGEKKEIKSY